MADPRVQDLFVGLCRRGDEAGAKRWLAEGADLDKMVGNDNWSATPLSAAAHSKNVTLAQWLIAQGAKVAGPSGATALREAGSAEMVQALIAGGVDVNARGKDTYSALACALSEGDSRLALALLDAGADPNLAVHGETPLHWATHPGSGMAKVVIALIDKGAKLEVKNSVGSTPLISATARARLDLVPIFLARGSDKNARNDEGKTAEQVAPTTKVKALFRGGAPTPTKAKMAALPPIVTPSIVDRFYAVSSNLFEGPWMHERKLGTALVAYGKDQHGEYAERAGKEPLYWEMLLRDESGPEPLAGFLMSLPPAVRRAALVKMRDELGESSDAASRRVAASITALLAGAPAKTPTKKSTTKKR